MVLQRAPQSAVIYGSNAAPNENIKVSGPGGKSWSSNADANGHWSVKMDPQPASTGNTLTVSTSTGRTQKLSNVAFGDVILCSGQSNMAFSVNLAFNATADIADSINYPNLRLFTAANIGASVPADDIINIQKNYPNKSVPLGPYATSSWAVSAPDAFVAVGGPTFTWPSAVCYYYGRDIYKSLNGKVPIGLVAASWGGEPIEPFMSAEALGDKTCGGTVEPPNPSPGPPSPPSPSPPPAPGGKCDATPFSNHHCSVGLINISSGAITTPEECVTASCVKFPEGTNFSYIGFRANDNSCMVGDWHRSPSCRRDSQWTTYLVNYSPPPPPSMEAIHNLKSSSASKLGSSSTIWNGMIAPFTQMRFSSIIWSVNCVRVYGPLIFPCSPYS